MGRCGKFRCNLDLVSVDMGDRLSRLRALYGMHIIRKIRELNNVVMQETVRSE